MHGGQGGGVGGVLGAAPLVQDHPHVDGHGGEAHEDAERKDKQDEHLAALAASTSICSFHHCPPSQTLSRGRSAGPTLG